MSRSLQAPCYVTVGKWVRERRAARGWTQEKLAERIGMKRTSVANIEAGKQRIALDTFLELERLLRPVGVTFRYLVPSGPIAAGFGPEPIPQPKMMEAADGD